MCGEVCGNNYNCRTRPTYFTYTVCVGIWYVHKILKNAMAFTSDNYNLEVLLS